LREKSQPQAFLQASVRYVPISTASQHLLSCFASGLPFSVDN